MSGNLGDIGSIKADQVGTIVENIIRTMYFNEPAFRGIEREEICKDIKEWEEDYSPLDIPDLTDGEIAGLAEMIYFRLNW
jgi:hypothetical protein